MERAEFPAAIGAHVTRGGELVGICGGYQILGREISDPFGVESGGRIAAFAFLDVATELIPAKITTQVEARPTEPSAGMNEIVRGYEIHMGRTQRGSVAARFRVLRRLGDGAVCGEIDREASMDGASSEDGRVWGTYIHGVFDQPGFRRRWLNQLRRRKGLEPLAVTVSETTSRKLIGAIDRWADHLERNLNLIPIFSALGIGTRR